MCFVCLFQWGQLWTGCADSVELCLWHTNNHRHPFKIISLPGNSGVTCMIRVKDQVSCDQHVRSRNDLVFAALYLIFLLLLSACLVRFTQTCQPFSYFNHSKIFIYPMKPFIDVLLYSQIWVGRSDAGGQCNGQLSSQVLVVDIESHTVAKELQAHSDSIQTLCSAEDRYVLSGSACRDGKIAIWKVEQSPKKKKDPKRWKKKRKKNYQNYYF